ncbi:MAG: ATP-dependent DNA helicase DinG [Treponema sp.]|jgi:ATP-dependent DNA helicase DinG|nr:ATP-dependent DNA helicase DinG [Treponema sp.]
MQADKRFTGACVGQLRTEIDEAGGNEVFALGYLDDKGIVSRIRVVARGNENSVLALRSFDFGEGDEAEDVFIHNHPSGFLTPSDNDLAIAGKAAESGVGAYIVDNPVQKVYVIAEPVRRRRIKKLDEKNILASLEEGGSVARRLENYEPRQSQLDLMELVIRGFNEDSLVAAEAGTGVGKSFAYLLPAVHYASDNNDRIVISTATITLQQQLYEKDIPLVTEALGKKIKVVLIKGRGNYVCRRRMEDALREPDLDDAEFEELRQITKWTETSKSGSRSDLSFSPSESVWTRICSEADLCMGMRCPERERCFVMSLRKEAADARLLVVNHHLLFADLAARHEGAGYEGTVVLPPYNRVIIDEAHTIENAATSFFSGEFSRLGILRQLGRLYRRRRAAKKGLLPRLAGLLSAEDELNELAALIESLREEAAELDSLALELCAREGVFRFSPLRDNSGAESALFPHFVTLRKKILSLNEKIGNLLERLSEKNGEDSVVWEIKTVLRRLDAIAGLCSAFPEYRERGGEVMWIERRQSAGGDPWAVCNRTPVEVAENLRAGLFEPNKTVVCVSATLTVGGDFSYWAGRGGFGLVKERQNLFGCFPSPFPYAKSVLLAAPEDAPLPEEEGYQNFVDRSVTELAAASGGSALVLFTSYQSLRSAYTAAVPSLQSLGIRCLKQGDDDRSRLLRTFLSDESSVLFATDSFWEGVDAPGDTLRLVILCRLPFRSPNDPVFEARRELIQKQGGNPFMDLSLPEAVMKFKQGFGRLMRRSSDHGVVAVLDGRIVKKRYGSFFLKSLPETRTSFTNLESVIRNVENFLSESLV